MLTLHNASLDAMFFFPFILMVILPGLLVFNKQKSNKTSVNPFVPNTPFLYPPKDIKNLGSGKISSQKSSHLDLFYVKKINTNLHNTLCKNEKNKMRENKSSQIQFIFGKVHDCCKDHSRN